MNKQQIGLMSLAALALFTAAEISSAEQVQLMPSATVVIPDSIGENSMVLLLFSLPADSSMNEISSADLSLHVDCDPEQGSVLAWAHPISTAWQNPPSSAWLSNGQIYDVKETSTCEMEECGDGVAHFEIGKWVRGWLSGDRANFGILLHPAAVESGAFKVAGTPSPILRITYKPPQPNEQGN